MSNVCKLILLVLQARSIAKLVGIRAKRLKDAAENPDDVTKAPTAVKETKPKK